MVHKEQITQTHKGLFIRAPAKLNLTLLIAGKRPDGFHELETVMAKVNWYDELLIARAATPGIQIRCAGEYWAPEGKDNIVHKACEMICERSGTKPALKVTLTKNIPAGSGLGSASSDAAATLVGLDKLLELNLPGEELAEMAAALGSDVAFFLDGPLALCTGKGEKIKKLPRIFNFSALLILPDVSVSTKKVYNDYTHDARLYETLGPRINALLDENRIDSAAQMCANMLAKSCFHLHKELAELKTAIEALGRGPVCLSGSGSTMFIIVGDPDSEDILEYQRKLARELGCKSVLVSNNRW